MAHELNPSIFRTANVVDACSIWNILSSKSLYLSATSPTARCSFCCTKFVYYECMIRPRKEQTEQEKLLTKRLLAERGKGTNFVEYHLDIEDLQELRILDNRKNLGKGELSSIIFAKKTRQAFMTDDKKARELAETVMDNNMVQTTPHLLGWLFYSNFLTDSDIDDIIEEHSLFRTTNWGNLSKFFKVMYIKGQEYKLMHRQHMR